jgi:outer membrane protein assembly factor BamB
MHHVIIDVTDGRIVADTKDLGIKYVNRRYVAPSLNGIIFSGVDNQGLALMMIDANTGKKLWTLQNIFESNNELLTAKPLAVDGQHIMLATTKRVYKVNTATGNVVWKSDFNTAADKLGLQTEVEPEEEAQASTKDGEKKGGGIMGMASKVPGVGGFAAFGSMGSDMRNGAAKAADVVYGKFIVLDNKPGTVYYYNTKAMTAFDLATGTQSWAPVKFSDPVANFILNDNGFLVATNDKNSELLLLDYKTGQQKWEPVKLSGDITAIKLTGNNLAVASAKESGKNMVNVININTGKPLASSALKVSGSVRDIRMIDKGLIYRTSEETNIQDINSGKDLWPSSLSYKGGGLGVDKGNQTYIWGSGKLYVLSHSDGTYKPLGNGVKFGGDEQPTAIELREKGILLSSDQNMALFDFDGNLLYHVYQKAPGISTFGKIMNAAAIGISVGNSASHGFQSGVSGGQTTSTGRSEMEKADRWGSIGSAAASDMSRRFKASQAADSYQVILTKVTTATDSGIGLVRVNKDSGKIEAKVVLDDKKPDYIADEVDNLIFYKNGGNRITGYKL